MNNAWDYRGTMIRASLWAAISGDKVTISALRMIWPISYGPYDMDLIFCIIPFIGFYRLFEFKGHLRVFEIFWTPNPRIVSILIVFIVSITLFEYWLWYPLSIVERQTLHHNICHEYYCIFCSLVADKKLTWKSRSWKFFSWKVLLRLGTDQTVKWSLTIPNKPF